MRNKAVKLLEYIEVNRLPSLPHVLVKLLQACREDDICFDSLSVIISQDASLTSKVIKAANSPVYGRARHLNSLKHTLMFLGFDTIKSIVITTCIKQFFSAYSVQKTHFLKTFWLHSLTCATLSRSLAKLTSYPFPEEAYLAGLLHDIGKLMMEPEMDKEYKSHQHFVYPADDILNIEKDTLDISHPELAAIMLEKWNMPDVICDAVRYHHSSPDQIQSAHLLAKIVNFSSMLTADFQNNKQSITTEAGILLFDLSESIINNITAEAIDEAHSLATSMDIDIGDIADKDIQEKDELKQIKLAQEVRDNALIQNSKETISENNKDIYKSIQQSVNLLFGIDNSLFLYPDDTLQFLCADINQYFTDTRLFENLKVNINSTSIVSQCFNKNKITNNFSSNQESSSILDEQITHALKHDGIICIPVAYNQQKLGVLVLSTNHNKAFKLLKDAPLLRLFADNLSSKIKQASDTEKTISDISTKQNDIFLDRGKKIIHETNNPLAVIRNYLQLLSKKIDSSSPAQSDINIIKNEIDRISNIISKCKKTPNTDELNLTHININESIIELTNLYNSSLFATHKIKYTLNLDKNIKPVFIDISSIKQIISNLLKNAVEAIASDGEINITTSATNINGKKYIQLILQDNGPGIPIKIMDKLYSPENTTKGESHSGLGLSISKNLVEKNNGLISCTSNKNGTVFCIHFPESKQ